MVATRVCFARFAAERGHHLRLRGQNLLHPHPPRPHPCHGVAVETTLHELFLTSPHRTFDPEEADFFYMVCPRGRARVGWGPRGGSLRGKPEPCSERDQLGPGRHPVLSGGLLPGMRHVCHEAWAQGSQDVHRPRGGHWAVHKRTPVRRLCMAGPCTRVGHVS